MKKTILIIFAVQCLLHHGSKLHAQVPNWTWAKQIADTSSEMGYDITTDSIGNVYSVGYFRGPTLSLATTTLINAGSGTGDIYFTKYNSSGSMIWAKRIGDSGYEFSKCIAADKSGNVYVAGYFDSPTLNLGSVTFTNTSVAGCEDLFLAKYDTNGNLIWAKSATGSGSEEPWGMCLDGSGNAYITGRCAGASLTIGSNVLTHIGSGANIFVAKFDANGNALWAKASGGTYGTTWGSNIGFDVSTDPSGNVYLAGYTSCITYTFGTSVMNTNGVANGLLLKYDALGNPLWAVNMSNGGLANFPTGVTTDAMGNSVITGYAFGSAFTIGTTTLTTGGGTDVFMVKFDAAGNLLWAKTIGGSSAELAQAISSDASGNTYITGGFTSSTMSFGSTTLTRMGNEDVFVAKFDASGNPLWAKSAYGNSAEGRGISVDASNNIYVTGLYKDTCATYGGILLNNLGNYDAFVAKLSASTAGIKESKLYNSVVIYPNPFSSMAAIKFDRNVNNASIKIINLNGQIVREINNFNGTDFVLSRENLQAGMYFLKIESEDEVISPIRLIVY